MSVITTLTSAHDTGGVGHDLVKRFEGRDVESLIRNWFFAV